MIKISEGKSIYGFYDISHQMVNVKRFFSHPMECGKKDIEIGISPRGKKIKSDKLVPVPERQL